MKIKMPKFKLAAQYALITGLVMGILAAVGQGFFGVQPPVAEVICLISLPAKLVNWVSNTLFATEFTISGVFATTPALLPVGVIIGSVVAAVLHREFRFRRGPVRDAVFAFMLGFLVINFGLLWGSCPIRTTILASYGMIFAMVIVVVIAVGCISAAQYIRWRARRQ